MSPQSQRRLAWAALMAGGTGIGFAPILVRMSEVGPSATAGFRVLLATPLLWLWVAWESRRVAGRTSPPRQAEPLLVIFTALLFVGDLGIWHWSLLFTSVANSTLLTNFAPVLVALGAWIIFHERVPARFLWGMLLALGGATLLVSASLHFGLRHLWGDTLAVVATFFYAGYQLMVKRLRLRLSAAATMAWTSLVSGPCFLLVAALSGEVLLPRSGAGWGVLLALGLVSHVLGQGCIAYAFGHLPASLTSLGLLVQPVVAAALAWLLLHEPLVPLQFVGGAITLAGIALASRAAAESPARSHTTPEPPRPV